MTNVVDVTVVVVVGRAVRAVRVVMAVRWVGWAGDVEGVDVGRIVRTPRNVAVGVGNVRTSREGVGSKKFRSVRMNGSTSEEGGGGQERAKVAKKPRKDITGRSRAAR